MLLDEPAHQLDLHHQLVLLTYFSRLARESGYAVVMSLHDVNLAVRFCTQTLLLFGQGETVQVAVHKLDAGLLGRLYRTPVHALATPAGLTIWPAEHT